MKYVLIALLGAATCTPEPRPTPTPAPAPTVVEPAPEPEGCSAVCRHLADMACESATPTAGEDGVIGTPDDGTCLAVCENIQHSGTVTYPFACVLAAKTCEAADNCPE